MKIKCGMMSNGEWCWMSFYTSLWWIEFVSQKWNFLDFNSFDPK